MLPTVVSTGRAAVAAGVLMIAGIQGEWLLNPQRDDGTVTNTPAFVLLLTMTTLGFALLTLAIRGLRQQTLREQTARPTRPARAGAFLTMVGAGLLTAFSLVVLITGIILGAPLELSFLLFALGMLSLVVGQLTWGLTLRRHSPAPGVWQLLTLAGITAFATIAIPTDPWHDVALVAMCATWSTIGVLVLRPAARRRSESPVPPR